MKVGDAVLEEYNSKYHAWFRSEYMGDKSDYAVSALMKSTMLFRARVRDRIYIRLEEEIRNDSNIQTK